MAPRIRSRAGSLPASLPKVRNVNRLSPTGDIKQALDQARRSVQAAKTPREKKKAQSDYIKILAMMPQQIPEGQKGSPRFLSTKERAEQGNIPTYGDKSIPPGARLRRGQVSDAGEKISDYMKNKYPNKKKGGKITYKMKGGQVVAISYD